MFSLMDKVPSGIEPMLKDLEEHIMSAGLADMVASAETITSVSHMTVHMVQGHGDRSCCTAGPAAAAVTKDPTNITDVHLVHNCGATMILQPCLRSLGQGAHECFTGSTGVLFIITDLVDVGDLLLFHVFTMVVDM